MHEPGAILLLSCYELGHAPHGLAMPMAFLERAGFAPACVDLSVQALDDEHIDRARVVVISVPMHTALRMGARAAMRVRARNPRARIAFFGLYAPLNAEYLRGIGADWILGGESEATLVDLVSREHDTQPGQASAGISAEISAGARVDLVKLDFPAPSRRALPALARYAHLEVGGARRLAGYTEASRGCLDRCRHCPVPAVYGGRFFIVPGDVVLHDIAAQVEAGAEHITFGDPDFLNGPRHGMDILRRVHARWPALTFDLTAQVTHLIRHRRHLAELAELGCAFVVSAVESLSDAVLARLHKRHRRAQVHEALALCRQAGVPLRPTFVTFTPWTSLDDVRELIDFITRAELVDHVDPIQLTIRLLVPPGSLLLGDPETRACFGPLDPGALTHPWQHPDARVDALQRALAARVEAAARLGEEPAATFSALRDAVYRACGQSAPALADVPAARQPVPRLSEPWFC
jgi:radical SAM superfamily enzyme YgiQ (UPF0313 family)